ncbi:MAG: hypothetical protein ACI3WU_01735 [Phascolarctobacterium sp.]
MDGQTYLKLLERRLERYFDKKALVQGDLQFSLVAELNASDEGYFLVHSIKTYSVQHNEYLFVKHFTNEVTKEELQPYLELLRQRMQELKTTTEHMSSLFALVIICEQSMDAALVQELEKYKYHKDYCFSLKGWSDLAIYVVDIPKQKVSCNKAGRKTINYFTIATQ